MTHGPPPWEPSWPTRTGPVEADGAVENAQRFPRASTGPFPSNHPRKTPKGPKIALGNPDRPSFCCWVIHAERLCSSAATITRRALLIFPVSLFQEHYVYSPDDDWFSRLNRFGGIDAVSPHDVPARMIEVRLNLVWSLTPLALERMIQAGAIRTTSRPFARTPPQLRASASRAG